MNATIRTLVREMKQLFLGDRAQAARSSQIPHDDRVIDDTMTYESIRSILLIR